MTEYAELVSIVTFLDSLIYLFQKHTFKDKLRNLYLYFGWKRN